MITEPSILTANTYFWTPSSSASSRRRNEARHESAVWSYLESLGFEVTAGCVHGVMEHPKYGRVVVVFSYQESCRNVYKSLSITRDGKRSNISILRKIAAEFELAAAA